MYYWGLTSAQVDLAMSDQPVVDYGKTPKKDEKKKFDPKKSANKNKMAESVGWYESQKERGALQGGFFKM